MHLLVNTSCGCLASSVFFIFQWMYLLEWVTEVQSNSEIPPDREQGNGRFVTCPKHQKRFWRVSTALRRFIHIRTSFHKSNVDLIPLHTYLCLFDLWSVWSGCNLFLYLFIFRCRLLAGRWKLCSTWRPRVDWSMKECLLKNTWHC